MSEREKAKREDFVYQISSAKSIKLEGRVWGNMEIINRKKTER